MRSLLSYFFATGLGLTSGCGVVMSPGGLVAILVPEIEMEKVAYVFEANVASTTGIPKSLGGKITGCTIDPALPTGLELNSENCSISGIPTVSSDRTTYVVTPTNAVGTGRPFAVEIEVSAAIAEIAYAQNAFVFPLHQVATSGSPEALAGAVSACEVDPALPAGLSLGSDCLISGTPNLASPSATYQVTPSNGYGRGVAVSITIEVPDVVPLITFAANSYTLSLNVLGGVPAPTNSGGVITGCTVSPALPTGLTLDTATCAITGTPTGLSASTSYAVTPSNAVGAGTVQSLSLEVVNTVPNIAFSSTTYAFDLQASSTTGAVTNTGGAITGCVVTPALPTGLTIAPTTCLISGTPSVVSASATYTVTPSNAVGAGTARTLSLAVNNVVPALAYSASSYNFSLHQSGATTGVPTNAGGTLTGCTVSPALPTGLSIDPASCAISGTPSLVAADASYTVTPANGVGNGTNVVLQIQVSNIVPSISYSLGTYAFDLNDAAASTGSPTSSGGAITNCTVSPALPTGLSINTTTCAISGTPSAVTSAANYTVTPSNAVGSGTARTISIEVRNVAPNIAFGSATYAFDLNAAGSTTSAPTNTGGAITNCTVSPALPTGLSISTTTCAISGTPSAVTANANYSVTPSNGAGSGTARTIAIEVRNIVPNITFASSGFSFSSGAAATTGTPTNAGGAITGCTVSPALPTGLTLNTTSCLVSGTPSGASASASYTVTPSNAVGSGTARTITIEVTGVPVPNIAYGLSLYDFVVEVAQTTGVPTNTGGTITNCTITPFLPSGYSINTTTCEVSGFSLAPASSAVYTVTPSNAGGSGTPRTFTLRITP